jgi:transcriptional regulator with XRE-family HTH domain
MSDLRKHIAERCAESSEFKAAYEAESALLALVRARQTANLTQKDVAEVLHVTQPYIAQIENGTRKPGYLLLFRYASAVGASIEVTSKNPALFHEATAT